MFHEAIQKIKVARFMDHGVYNWCANFYLKKQNIKVSHWTSKKQLSAYLFGACVYLSWRKTKNTGEMFALWRR